ncbi:phage virion morphogenesis protein [Sphingobium wenxiniae]|uniref:Phage virion morphogenesis protein n=1 Tax=Sphingobium wenxiniae (strain DSM 21828 / CGMCC 1.7748 / JZ-1) TaxID=595605 RepID=A0A562KCS0_SPHWJ|nr:phage virion morphogenesis protein [Sphingobium wenxiniae]MBB6191513.1 phage virion morphogenesis protein [Sphingobium wenxiniae]TWH93197.1 phage virion morphogenesis protein [Sphingobium wenxiniae]
MTDDLAEVERIAGALLQSLSSGQRRTLMRRMARELAKGQRERIAAQRQPDGSAFAPRKEKSPPVMGRGAACFLYPSGGGGAPRRVIMKSFAWTTGRMMTGFDIEAGGIRSFEFDKVVKWLPVPEEYRNAGAGKLRRRGGVRRRAMFRRLASGRFLRTGINDQGFWVGFSGKVSEIATVHQRGLRDKPSVRAAAIPYPRRELLGDTAADREHMLDMLYLHLADDLG